MAIGRRGDGSLVRGGQVVIGLKGAGQAADFQREACLDAKKKAEGKKGGGKAKGRNPKRAPSLPSLHASFHERVGTPPTATTRQAAAAPTRQQQHLSLPFKREEQQQQQGRERQLPHHPCFPLPSLVLPFRGAPLRVVVRTPRGLPRAVGRECFTARSTAASRARRLAGRRAHRGKAREPNKKGAEALSPPAPPVLFRSSRPGARARENRTRLVLCHARQLA